MKAVLREPLLHFLLLGAGIFLLFDWRAGPARIPAGAPSSPSRTILVTQHDKDQLLTQFTRTWQRPPTPEEMAGLVEGFIRDEIFYREALAAGLDRDDNVIKRRMRMQMEFILEDVGAIGEPSEADLQSLLAQHRDRYLVEAHVAFRHVYISADRRRENADADARQLLAQLRQGADPQSVGDPFALGAEFRL